MSQRIRSLLLAMLVPCGLGALLYVILPYVADPKSRPVAAGDPSWDELAAIYFSKYLRNCAPGEIRSVWFHEDWQRCGCVMTVDLNAETVYTARHVYNHAVQGSENRKLSHYQVLRLRDLLKELPPSHRSVEFTNAVCVSVQRNDRVEISCYERRNAPEVVYRLFDLGGGYFYDGRIE